MSTTINGDEPVVTRYGLLDMQVCVPVSFTDEAVEDFANRENPAGTTRGWRIRRQSAYDERGTPAQERCPCVERKGFTHLMLDC